MKNGINLSSNRSFFDEIPPTFWWFLVFAVLVVSGLHLAMMLRLKSAEEELSERVQISRDGLERLEQQLEAVRADLDAPAAAEAIERLVALDRAGNLAATIAPSDVLYEIARVLPNGARIRSLRLSAAVSKRELELDAVAIDPQAVVTFLGGLTDSALVRRAEVLEETPVSGGEFFYRIVAELAPRDGTK